MIFIISDTHECNISRDVNVRGCYKKRVKC